MTNTALPQLAALEAHRGQPAMVFHATLNDEAVDVLYECLRSLGRIENLDLVLLTRGGYITTTRRIALLLREYTERLTILAPYRVRSSGTLLCLSADELILGPLAELSPLDPGINATEPPPPNAQGTVSAADIRAFQQMAEDWFGVADKEDRLQVLAMVAQRFFPTSLSAFYRSDLMTRQIAMELLAYQLPQAEAEVRQRIVDQLVGGYYAHDYIITRADALSLGLNVRFTSPAEETLLWDLRQACQAQLADAPGQAEREVVGLIASTTFSAQQVHRWRPPSQAMQAGLISDVRWEIAT